MIPAPDIPGHTITGVLGTGGFAAVYRGWQVAVGREVAVKVDSRVLLSERDQRRFFREVNAAGRLSGHPNVIDIYDAGTLIDGRPYLVMELCPAGAAALRDALAALPEAPAYPIAPPSLASAPTLPPAWGGSADTTHGSRAYAVPADMTGGHSRRSSHAVSAAPRWQPAARAAALVSGGLALIIGAAAVAIGLYLHKPSTRQDPPTRSPSGAAVGNPPGTFGVATVTGGCPAAAVRAAAARCPADPECWQGTVDINGSVSAQSQPCPQSHSWETFAIAILPADVPTFDQDVVAANPAVRAVCSLSVLLRSRVGRARLIPRHDWEIQVMPPDETAYYSGARAYRCIASTVNGRYLAAPEFIR